VLEAGCGETFATTDELAARTIALARDPARLARLGAVARTRADGFAFDTFAEGLDAVVAGSTVTS
jgi:hypothetical protein